MNISIFRTLLYAALVFPALAGAQQDGDCHCTIQWERVGRFRYDITESPGCNLPAEDMCGITLGDGLGRYDLTGYEDLRGDTITIGSITFPRFAGSTLVNSRTYFKLDLDIPLSITLDGVDLVDAVIDLFENRVSAYNDLLAQCQGVCTLAFPNFSSAAPITLMEWEVEAARDHIALEWLTADEKDNDYFLVKHSTDGLTYTPIATISGQGTTELASTYRYEHRDPPAGPNYYRLEQYDYDGTVSQLGVRYVSYGSNADQPLAVSPNPVVSGQRLAISGPISPDTEVELIDPSGRRVSDIILEGQSFRVPILAPGIYTLRLNGQATRLVVAR